jgi:multidrug efflux pump subunit AcrA (membrane-fusion protein)
MTLRLLIFAVLIALFSRCPVVADEPASPSDESASATSAKQTHTVEPQDLKVVTKVDGVFVASETAEVILRPEQWSDFEIVEIVSHGSHVAKGEVLVQFDAKKLDQQIAELEIELRLGELELMKAEQELPRATAEIERQYEQAQRALAEAEADYQRYREVDREMSLKSAEMSLKSMVQYVENAREELRQLERMYEADDLTEETEEIILKRQRADVEQAEFRFESAKKSHDETINTTIPRRDIAQKEQLESVQRAFDRAKTALETDRAKAKYELEQKRQARRQAVEKHAKLVQDRTLMEVRSPADGVVYYGGAVDGEWSDTGKLIGSMRPFGKAPTGSVMMTIVKPGSLFVIGSIGEADRAAVEVGQSATIATAAADGPSLSGKLTALSNIPHGDKKYRVELSVESEELPDWLVAGLSAKAEVTTYHNESALMVPKAAVKTDQAGEEKYVWVVSPESDKPQKQSVKVGKSKDDLLEIVDGLEAGQKVWLGDEPKSA